MSSGDFPDGSRDNPANLIFDQQEEQELQFAMIAEQEEEEQRRRSNAESSDLSRKDDVQNQEKAKSKFQDGTRAIENNSISSTSSGDNELNLMTNQRAAPTLTDLCVRALAQHSESIKSLDLVPDHLKKKLVDRVSNSGRINKTFMQLLIQDSPSKVSARNCSVLKVDELTDILCACDTANLKVLVLGLCVRCMKDETISRFLERSPNGFPSLTKLTLQGAYALTDYGIALIARSAPLLLIMNISDCSSLTSQSVEILADTFGSTLTGLHIGGCHGIKPCNIFRKSFKKFKKLNSLSVAGLDSLRISLVEFFTFRGSKLTDLSLAACTGLTDGTIETLGRCCPKLEALDIADVDNLTDKSLKEVMYGCRSLQSVNLTRNQFSDVAVAKFLKGCGRSLKQLSLNSVREVGKDTAISLAENCKMLHDLDLSWCQKLREEELIRHILCSCLSLKSLKICGWTEVNNDFLEELSRSQVHIVGLKMLPRFPHLDDSYPSMDAKFF